MPARRWPMAMIPTTHLISPRAAASGHMSVPATAPARLLRQPVRLLELDGVLDGADLAVLLELEEHGRTGSPHATGTERALRVTPGRTGAPHVRAVTPGRAGAPHVRLPMRIAVANMRT